MLKLNKEMILILKTVDEIVNKNTPKNEVEGATIQKLIGKLDDSLVDDTIFELLNSEYLESDTEPIVFGNGLKYRPLTGISEKGKIAISNL